MEKINNNQHTDKKQKLTQRTKLLNSAQGDSRKNKHQSKKFSLYLERVKKSENVSFGNFTL